MFSNAHPEQLLKLYGYLPQMHINTQYIFSNNCQPMMNDFCGKYDQKMLDPLKILYICRILRKESSFKRFHTNLKHPISYHLLLDPLDLLKYQKLNEWMPIIIGLRFLSLSSSLLYRILKYVKKSNSVVVDNLMVF